MNTYTILCHLVKSLNYVVYEHILIERVTEEVKRMLTVINILLFVLLTPYSVPI